MLNKTLVTQVVKPGQENDVELNIEKILSIAIFGGTDKITLFDPTATYMSGDIILVNIDGKYSILKCKTDSVTGEFNPDNWDQAGLGSIENYGIATKEEAEAGISNEKYMTPQRTKEAFDAHIKNPSVDSIIIGGKFKLLYNSQLDSLDVEVI